MAEGHGQGAATWEDKAWAASEIVAAAIDAGTGGAFHANQARQGLEALIKSGQARDKKYGIKPNPRFVANGFGDRPSPVTKAYLQSRAWKSIGGTVVSAASGAASALTVVSAGGVARHGSALATTGIHLGFIASIARSAQATDPIVADWCKVIAKAKGYKAGARALETASAAIPIPVAGPVIKIVATAAKIGIKIGAPEMCYAAAIEIHWAAFTEQGRRDAFQRLGEGKWKLDTQAGPASKIFQEMFTRRGMTAVFGAYDVMSLVFEPGGWLALGDKIAMA